MLGAGGAIKKTYLDDVFHVQVHAGSSATRSINNGIDLSGEGGLVWAKTRNQAYHHTLFDTVRGSTKLLRSSSNSGEATYTGNGITSFNNNGYTLGNDSSWQGLNHSGNNYALSTFRKAPGFFTCLTYTGTGVKRTVSHDLGCQPGMIAIKRTDVAGENWNIWHTSLGALNASEFSYLVLNTSSASTGTSRFGTPGTDDPTSTTFTVKTQDGVNASGGTYVAYLWGGGESTADNARSVEQDANDSLSLAASNDFHLTGDFTLEWWCKSFDPSVLQGILEIGTYNVAGGVLIYTYQNKLFVYQNATDNAFESALPPKDQWAHYAIVRSGSTTTVYMNGVSHGSFTNSNDWGSSSNKTFQIGSHYGVERFQGRISNLRLVKGTAVYTSSFRPPTEPLTNITNTKLLCCNGTSNTSSTVTPGTITANGNPFTSSDSPFDDPAAHVFGQSGSESVIKCGSYVGNNSTAGPEINLGWEPQWILIKKSSGSEGWVMWDTIRGIVTGGNDPRLEANTIGSEATSTDYLDLTPTGFKPTSTNGTLNAAETYVYMAIRRPDGYVGKPAEVGTDVFAMDTGLNKRPNFDSGFPVDFALARPYASSSNWYTAARPIQGKSLIVDSSNTQGTQASFMFDDNEGWDNATWGATGLSWMWKRHAGFDVVTYQGNDVKQWIPHSLSKTPEMIWIKSRGYGGDWAVYHKDLPVTYSRPGALYLNSTSAAFDQTNFWSTSSPTSTHFYVDGAYLLNKNNIGNLAMLFASVDGISKVGSYDGSGGGNTQTITTGFQPRFLIVKCTTHSSTPWYVFDTTRGWASGGYGDFTLKLNDSAAQANPDNDWSNPISTGFTVSGNGINISSGSQKFIYYAHA